MHNPTGICNSTKYYWTYNKNRYTPQRLPDFTVSQPFSVTNNLIYEKWSIYSIKPLQQSANIYTIVYLNLTTGKMC